LPLTTNQRFSRRASVSALGAAVAPPARKVQDFFGFMTHLLNLRQSGEALKFSRLVTEVKTRYTIHLVLSYRN
jgi:hypothetical protein